MKRITAFIRLVEGRFEKVTWYKNEDGSKHATIELHQPTDFEAIQIAKSKYQETYLQSDNN